MADPADSAEAYEEEYVHRFYREKASAFSASRYKPWPLSVAFAAEYVQPGTAVLDCGCGNGREFLTANTVGVDLSEGLLAEARGREQLGLVRADIRSLPFGDCQFDVVMSVAVIHHLSTEERRRQCMGEMHRVLRRGGVCLVYAWGTHAAGRSKFREAGRGVGASDYLVSWRGETDALRYYHLLDRDGLVGLCEAGGFRVLRAGTEEESVYAVLQKE